MSNTEVDEAILTALRKLGCDAEVILPVHDLQCDLGIDSTEMIELAVLVRSECGLEAQRLNLDEIVTVGDLGRQVETLLRQLETTNLRTPTLAST
ncbi:MAG TPA: acyl carrier protein [Pyrinomonadaceae bacterium]